jgi:aspartate aminotransferase
MLNQDMLALGTARSTIRELFEYGKKLSQRIGAENVFDFSLGNPSIPAPEEVNATLKKLIDETPSTLLHGYTAADGDASVRRVVADFISNQFSAEAYPENIYMTVGAAAALTCTLRALTSAGDEVLILAPYFPEYRVFIESVGARVKVSLCHPESFRPNIRDIEEKISEKCGAVIINSPNNPSGAVYTEEDIKAIAQVLLKKSRDYGHPIYIISDEPYRELTYGGVQLPFIPNFYMIPWFAIHSANLYQSRVSESDTLSFLRKPRIRDLFQQQLQAQDALWDTFALPVCSKDLLHPA